MIDTKQKPINYNFNLVNKDTVRAVLSLYGLDEEFLLIPFVGTQNSIKTLFYQSKTANKATIRYGESTLFLKEVPWYCDDLSYVEFVYNHVYPKISENINCPKLYQTKTGKYYSETDGKKFLLFEFVFGGEWSSTTEQAYSVGFELAKFHKYGNLVRVKKIYKKNIVSSTRDMINLSENNHLLQYLERYADELVDYRECLTLVHSDSTPSNYIFNKNTVSALLDFDNVKFDNPVRDLAESICSFAIVKYIDNSSSYQKIFNTIDFNIADSILNGYKNGLEDDTEYKKILVNLKPAIKIMLMLFYSLSILRKDDAAMLGFKPEAINLELLDSLLIS